MKCDDCEHLKFYDGGIIKKLDDLSFHYCEKEHWEFDERDLDQRDLNKSVDIWNDCIDFKNKNNI